MQILALNTMILYLGVMILQRRQIKGKAIMPRKLAIACNLIPLIFHAYLLHQWIDTPAGQNLSITNMASFIAWLTAIFITFAALQKQVENLLFVIIPLNMFSILAVMMYPSQYIIMKTANTPFSLLHIIIATITLSILLIAAVQASIIIVQNYALRHSNNNKFIKFLPPLEIMEQLLFQIIFIGFIVLSLTIAGVIMFMPNITTSIGLAKIILAITTWGLFAVLLYQRKRYGLRGVKANVFVLIGVSILILGYFGHQYILETLESLT